VARCATPIGAKISPRTPFARPKRQLRGRTPKGAGRAKWHGRSAYRRIGDGSKLLRPGARSATGALFLCCPPIGFVVTMLPTNLFDAIREEMLSAQFDAYRREIETELQAGNATELTHRPAPLEKKWFLTPFSPSYGSVRGVLGNQHPYRNRLLGWAPRRGRAYNHSGRRPRRRRETRSKICGHWKACLLQLASGTP
jgi:hypothetical protein